MQKRILQQFCNILNQTLGFPPANTGISDGFSIDMLANFLASVFQITFNHKALYHVFDVLVMTASIEHVLADSRLLVVLFGRIGVVCIDDKRRIL